MLFDLTGPERVSEHWRQLSKHWLQHARDMVAKEQHLAASAWRGDATFFLKQWAQLRIQFQSHSVSWSFGSCNDTTMRESIAFAIDAATCLCEYFDSISFPAAAKTAVSPYAKPI